MADPPNRPIDATKLKLETISGELYNDMPEIVRVNTERIENFVSEHTAAGYPEDRIDAVVCMQLRAALVDKAATQRAAIESALPHGFTADQLWDAYQQRFNGDDYRRFHLGLYTQTLPYDARKCTLSEYLEDLYRHLHRANITDDQQLRQYLLNKLPPGPALSRWQSHRSRPEFPDTERALQALAAEDQLMIAAFATAPTVTHMSSNKKKTSETSKTNSVDRKDGCPKHGGPKANHSAQDCRSASTNKQNNRVKVPQPKPYNKPSSAQQQQGTPAQPSVCFGCGLEGHRKQHCPYAAKVAEFQRELRAAQQSAAGGTSTSGTDTNCNTISMTFGTLGPVVHDPTRVVMPGTTTAAAATTTSTPPVPPQASPGMLECKIDVGSELKTSVGSVAHFPLDDMSDVIHSKVGEEFSSENLPQISCCTPAVESSVANPWDSPTEDEFHDALDHMDS